MRRCEGKGIDSEDLSAAHLRFKPVELNELEVTHGDKHVILDSSEFADLVALAGDCEINDYSGLDDLRELNAMESNKIGSAILNKAKCDGGRANETKDQATQDDASDEDDE